MYLRIHCLMEIHSMRFMLLNCQHDRPHAIALWAYLCKICQPVVGQGSSVGKALAIKAKYLGSDPFLDTV